MSIIIFIVLGMIEYCEDSSFNPSCGPDEVIMMQSARYGRMEVATCLAKDYGHLGCSADILGVLDGMCSGRRSCDVDVRDLMVSGQKPCPKDLRSYLEAQYTCLPISKLIWELRFIYDGITTKPYNSFCSETYFIAGKDR